MAKLQSGPSSFRYLLFQILTALFSSLSFVDQFAFVFNCRVFQDCAVGLLFALLPVLGGNSGLVQGMISMGKL